MWVRLLDADFPDYKTSANNTSPDEERREVPIGMQQNFQEQLLSQLYTLELDDKEYHIAEQLIGSLDDDGYLRRELSAIVDDLAFSQNIMTTPEELEADLPNLLEDLGPRKNDQKDPPKGTFKTGNDKLDDPFSMDDDLGSFDKRAALFD